MIAGNQGQNIWPSPENYPVPTFPQPVPAPTVDPSDAGTLIQVQYSWEWQQVLLACIDQVRNPATWQGDHDAVILAVDRATELKALLQIPVAAADMVETPYWDDSEDVDDDAPADDQRWYGGVTDPTAPPGELDFVESALLWAVTGFVAVATFEVGGLAPAIFFHTAVEKFILIQKRGDAAETIRYVIDNQDMRMLDTSPYAPGDLIEVTLEAPPSEDGHDIMIVQVT